MKRIRLYAGLCVLACAILTPLVAMGNEDLNVRLEALEKELAELRARSEQQTEQRNEAIRQVLTEMREDTQVLPVLPGWLENFKFSGDLRLRYEGQFYDWNKQNRNRARYRARFGFSKKLWDDQFEIGVRLASGESNDPTSANQSFTDNYSQKYIFLDRAYAKFTPNAIQGLTLTGGKMPNPWIQNDIFFDTDINPEGFFAHYKAPSMGTVELFGGAGAFILRHQSSAGDSTMIGGQIGANIVMGDNLKWTTGGYWQTYNNYDLTGVAPRGNANPLSRAGSFGVVGVNNALKWRMWNVPVRAFFDWAHNCLEDDNEKHYSGANNAYAAGVDVGSTKKKGDWAVKYRWAYVEANAMPGYFMDSDFGFANRKGHVIGATYNLLDNVTMGASVYVTEPIFTPTSTAGNANEGLTTIIMVDVVWKF